jgi:hypothetical protein
MADKGSTIARRILRKPLAVPGVGRGTAAALLIAAAANDHRVRSSGALASSCGASPIEASSGKTPRASTQPSIRRSEERFASCYNSTSPNTRRIALEETKWRSVKTHSLCVR